MSARDERLRVHIEQLAMVFGLAWFVLTPIFLYHWITGTLALPRFALFTCLALALAFAGCVWWCRRIERRAGRL